MNKRYCLCLVFFLTAAIFSLAGSASGISSGISSGIESQTGVEVTVYNSNIGLVKDKRKIVLEKGVNELRFMEVPSRIIPASVSVESLTDGKGVRVLEQNYEFDLINPRKLLDKYVGKEVKLYTRNPYTEREEIVTATVVANNEGGPVFRIGDELTFGHPGRVIFPSLPENLIPRPTLMWFVHNDTPGEHVIEAAYLTQGISWNADYVVALSRDDSQADISGWVTIDNRSGTTYRDAKLKLVAGDVNRVMDTKEMRTDIQPMTMKAMAVPSFRESAFSEYHLYSLQRTSTIKDNQTKQIGFLDADAVKAQKEYVSIGEDSFFRGSYNEDMPNQRVGVFIRIENRKENGLGIPLPRGIVRVYKRDGEGALQFAGEDAVDHTPKDEKIRVKLGDAFDIAVVRKQTGWRKIVSDTYEAAYRISVRNRKEEDVTIKFVEPIPGDWKILESSHGYTKSSSSHAEFVVATPKDKETVLSYTVRIRF
ncbi:MAG: DUF4139 domain-containing protein [Alphaproteobacteria bacterium]|uniref:DUF4139 domain-containing protein n=1 Tax=Candidatus Nitrobium versatile TaxID=2884831 RepID=A0A953LZJ3_9BACT|nr:DUF4139 domain-containing protein [Candidatus Nitrobium versatile]